MSGKWYLAGPMSGLPKYNIPVFDAAAAELREQGFDIVSPAELDDPEFRAACLRSRTGRRLPRRGTTWGELLARDILLVSDEGLKGIILLPGWSTSRGARLEAFVGLLCEKEFRCYRTQQPVSAASVRGQLRRNMP